jgi:hypothetical protein
VNNDIRWIDIDDPNHVAGHVWSRTPDSAERTFYQGVEGECATVTVNGLRFAIGFDPHGDGMLWTISSTDTSIPLNQWDAVSAGGWATGDRRTADAEIADIINTLNQKGAL